MIFHPAYGQNVLSAEQNGTKQYFWKFLQCRAFVTTPYSCIMTCDLANSTSRDPRIWSCLAQASVGLLPHCPFNPSNSYFSQTTTSLLPLQTRTLAFKLLLARDTQTSHSTRQHLKLRPLESARMPQLSRARQSKADSVLGKRSRVEQESSDDEPAGSRPTTRKSNGQTSQQGSVPEASMANKGSLTSPKPHSHLLDYIAKKVANKHDKPFRDDYNEDLKALGEGRKDAHPGQAGAMDRKSLKETAKLKLQAGLESVQPAIAKEIEPFVDIIVSEYQLKERADTIKGLEKRLATLKRDNATRARGKRVKFTRAEVEEAHEVWVAKRTSLGLPLDGDLDDLAPQETGA